MGGCETSEVGRKALRVLFFGSLGGCENNQGLKESPWVLFFGSLGGCENNRGLKESPWVVFFESQAGSESFQGRKEGHQVVRFWSFAGGIVANQEEPYEFRTGHLSAVRHFTLARRHLRAVLAFSEERGQIVIVPFRDWHECRAFIQLCLQNPFLALLEHLDVRGVDEEGPVAADQAVAADQFVNLLH